LSANALVAQNINSKARAAGKMAYNDAEVSAMLEKPLGLEDCIGIALRRNIMLDLAKRDLDIARLSVSGSYATFYPTFSIIGTQIQTNQNRPVDPSSLDDGDSVPITDFRFDNKLLTASISQKFITGADLTFSTDLRRDVDSPDYFGEPPTETNNRSFSFQIVQPLLRDGWFSMTKSPINLAKYILQGQGKNLDAIKLQTIFNVKEAFFSVLLQREILKANEAAIKRDSTLMRLSIAKYKASLATRRDVLSAEIQLAEDQASLIATQADYEFALDQLKDAMGLPINAPMQIAEIELSYSTGLLNEEELVERALENNPLISLSEYNIKSLNLQRKIAKNKLLPRLDLMVGYEDKFDNNTQRFAKINTKDFQVSLNFIYTFQEKDNSVFARVQQADIALSQERTKLVDIKRQIILDIRRIIRSIYANIQAIEVLKKNIEAANEKVRFATTMFNLGRASNLDITDAQQVLLKTEILYVSKLTDYHLLLAQLETLIGEPVAH
jgi:outer membrane protein TolC